MANALLDLHSSGSDGAGSRDPKGIGAHDLPTMVLRAGNQLLAAKDAAEVLAAKETASLVYDLAKRAARLGKAKHAHDELIAAAYRAQADALEIESHAKRRLADEYDAARERGEVAGQGKPVNIPDGNVLPTAADIGLTPKIVHEARQIRDAEEVQPGVIRQILDQRLANGQEPSRAAVREAVIAAAKQGRRGEHAPQQSRRNPEYDVEPAWEAMLSVVSPCREIMTDAAHLDLGFIFSGFVNQAQRDRSVKQIRECRDYLNTLLEYADAQ